MKIDHKTWLGLAILIVVLVGLSLTFENLPRIPLGGSLLQANPTLNDSWGSINGIVNGPPSVWAFPGPYAGLTQVEYQQGIPGPDTSPTEQMATWYNICVYTDPLSGRVAIANIPVGIPGRAPSPSAYDLSATSLPITFTDAIFWENVELWLDGQQLNAMEWPKDMALQMRQSDYSAYYLCYRIELEVGIHYMRYVFYWEPANISDIGEWEFTIMEDNSDS